MLDRLLQFFGLGRDPVVTPLNLLEQIQRDAWKEAGFLGRENDRSFAYSPNFSVPDEVQRSIVTLITMAGQGPIKLNGPTPPSRFQENLTFPMLDAAFCRLNAAAAIPPTLRLGDSLLIGTAPLASIYPQLAREHLRGQVAIVFSTGMLVLHMLVGELLARVGESRSKLPSSLEDLLCHSSLHDLDRVSTTLHGVAESLFGIVTENWPFPAHGTGFESMPRQAYPAEMLSDSFAFCLLHELAHVSLEHRAHTTRKDTREREECAADVIALQGTLSSRQPAANTFPAVVAVLVLFETMSLIYRTVNFLAFRVDYSQMSEASMGHLYFRSHGSNLYPHPRTRLFFLLEELKRAHAGYANRLDTVSERCHTFFDNVWVRLEQHYAGQHSRPAASWRAVEELHRRAHDAAADSRG